MTTCSEMRNDYNKFYRQLSDYERELDHLESLGGRIGNEIEALKRRWKNDVSRREMDSVLLYVTRLPLFQAIGPLVRGVDKQLNHNTPSRQDNAVTYNYIKSLEKEYTANKRRQERIQSEMRRIELILERIDAELRAMKC